MDNSKKKLIIVTGGGDCPGLNAVIRAVVKRARKEKGWAVFGSDEAFGIGVLGEELQQKHMPKFPPIKRGF